MKKLVALLIALTVLPFSLFSQYNQCRQVKSGGSITRSPQSISYLLKKWEIGIYNSKNQEKVASPLILKPYTYPTQHNDQLRRLIATPQPSTSSIEAAIQWHRKKSKADYSGFIFMAYSLLCDPNMIMQSQKDFP